MMSQYKVTVVRSFSVVMQVNTPDDAARLSECYIGYSDDSEESDRDRFKFRIHEIEMIQNDAIEVSPIQDENQALDDE
ncbi:MAG: hypothetical protein ONA90_07195 [candidate division KSB1 bacterium]|nr:hypothetical protein [candidate division KSB1 bacterium]